MNLNFKAVEGRMPMMNAILEQLPPGSMIAGGYIRDLLLDKPTRDIDIFVEYTEDDATASARAILGAMFDGEFEADGVDVDEEYGPMDGRRSRVHQLFRLPSKDEADGYFVMETAINPEHEIGGQVEGIGLDLIEVTSVETHFEEFPDSLSRVGYSLTRGIVYGTGFGEAVGSGYVPYKGLEDDSHRLLKLRAKFPEFVFAEEREAEYA